MFRRTIIAGVCGIAALLSLGCGGDDSGDTGGETQPAESSPVSASDQSTTESASSNQAQDGNDSEGAGDANAPSGEGMATLTIGDQSWRFEGVYCAMGPEQTQNDRVSFSSGAFGEVEGHRTQLDATIQDSEEEGRYEGDGVIYSVSLDDVDDFENPVVSWASISGLFGTSETSFQVDGNQVIVEATFDDGNTDALEEVPGTLELSCP